ncbi:MAG: MTH1187 family thiamine-binding protein [Peptococcaceae bacterium]
MAIAELVVVPLGTGTSISKYVAQCHEVLDRSGLKYQLTPMGTVVEGSLAEIMAIAEKMHEVPFQNGAQRVSTSIRIDDRRDKEITMEGKIAAVEEKKIK